MADVKLSQDFWKTLFEAENVAPQLLSISAKPDGVCFPSVGQYGEVNFKCHPASKLGDNFMSDTFIAMATTQDGTDHRTFIKILPTNILMRDMAYSSGAHQREMSMYTTFFDLLRQIREESELSGEELSLDVPHIYYIHMEVVVKGENDGSAICILMEDLSKTGFCMADKHKGCDDDHVRLALNSLVKYHAMSLACLRKWTDQHGQITYPGEAKFLEQETMFDKIGDFFQDTIKQLCDRLRLLKRTDLSGWLEELNGKLGELFARDTFENVGPLACVLHGDYWGNNMLYKYGDTENSTKPTELKMIDFQMSRISHPIVDLLYFLYSSTLPGVRQEHMTTWLTFYFDTLMASLKQLKVDIPQYTLNDFMAEYKKRSITMMLFSCGIIMTVLDKESVSHLSDVEQFIKDNPDSDEDGEQGSFGYSKKMEEKVKKFIEEKGPNMGNPAINDRIVKLIEEVAELNGIVLN